MPRARRERRLIAGLSLTLGLLVAGVVLVVREDAREPDVASALPADEISRIAIERPGFDDIVLAREGADWRVEAPCVLEADETRVEPLLTALAAGGEGYAAGEVDLEAAGLDEPLASVRLDEERILLGGTDLGGERRYARRGDRVTLVPEWTLSLVSGGLSAFASLAPFDAPPTRLVRREPVSAATPASAPASTSDSTSSLAPAAPPQAPSASASASAASSDPRSDSAAGPAAESGRDAVVPIEPSPWTSLSADQVAPWPVPDAPPTLERVRLDATFEDGTTRTIDVVRTGRWSALRLDDADCAYLFGSDALPPEFYR